MSKSKVLDPVPPRYPEGGTSTYAVVGDFPRKEEILSGNIFSGPGGQELMRWLHHDTVQVNPDSILFTNIFKYKPIRDDAANFFIKKQKVKKDLPKDHKSLLPYHSSYNILAPAREHDLLLLKEELHDYKVKYILGLGEIPLWAFTGLTKINAHRGTIFDTTGFLEGFKYVPTLHPSSIIRGRFDQRLVVLSDIRKWKDPRSPLRREIWTEPQLKDLIKFEEEYCTPLPEGSRISFDIETGGNEITCIGFAPDEKHAIVVPFYDDTMPDKSYWPTPKMEVTAWQWVKNLLENPRYTFVAHNGSYDIIWLKERLNITVHTPYDDTMHMHHAWQPEMKKGLGFLASLYTNESSWKHLVSHNEEKRGNKRDE